MAEVEDDDSEADQSVITPNDPHLDNPVRLLAKTPINAQNYRERSLFPLPILAHPHTQDCIQLTEDQYKCIAELGKDPKFSGTASTKLTFPSWTEIMNGTKDTFTWVVFSSYLGVLKFGFISKGIDGGIILYDKILFIFERQLEAAVVERNSARFKKNVYKPPSVMALCFHHVGEGQFIVNLDLSHRRYNVPDMVGEPENEMKKLASEAFLVNRSRNPTAGITHSARLQEPVKHLPGNEQGLSEGMVLIESVNVSLPFLQLIQLTWWML